MASGRRLEGGPEEEALVFEAGLRRWGMILVGKQWILDLSAVWVRLESMAGQGILVIGIAVKGLGLWC